MATFIQFISSGVGLALISSAISMMLPSPTDFAHFLLQNYLYTKRLHKITYEILQSLDWYFLDASWYWLLFLVAFLLAINNMDVINIIIIIATILSIGAVIGITARFIMKRK